MPDSNVELFPIIDGKVLKGLASIMDDEFIDVLQTYQEEALSLMNDIHGGFADGNANVLTAISALKSSSADVGARQLSAMAQKMESCMLKGQRTTAGLMLDELQDAFAKAYGELDQIIKNGLSCSIMHQ